MSAVAETAVIFLGIDGLVATGIIGAQVLWPKILVVARKTATPQDTRAAADERPAALGSTTSLALTEAFACPRCGTRALRKRGTVLRPHGLYQQYRCGDGHWFRVLIGSGNGHVLPIGRAS